MTDRLKLADALEKYINDKAPMRSETMLRRCASALRAIASPDAECREALAELLRHWQRATNKFEHSLRTSSGFETRASELVHKLLKNVREKTVHALAIPQPGRPSLDLQKIADVIEPHWRGAGLELTAEWIIDQYVQLGRELDAAPPPAIDPATVGDIARKVREADIVTGAMAIARSRGHDPDEAAPLTEMCTEYNAPVPWWMVFVEESEACLKAVALATNAKTPGNAEAVAWTNEAQLEHLKTHPGVPMAMWEKRGNHADIPLYLGPVSAYDQTEEKRPAAFLAWAVEMFGPVAKLRSERLMRFVEEAIELAHADNMERNTLDLIANRVYSREPGEITKEIGQAQACLEMYAENIEEISDMLADIEWQRVRKIPRAEWDRRHAAKVAIGIAASSPAYDKTGGA